MELKERLARIEDMNRPTQVVDRKSPLEEILPGQEVKNPLGSCFVVTSSFPVGYKHGFYSLQDISPVCPQAMSFLTGKELQKPLHLHDAVFLDTETTGLGSGAGTYVFMVGLGFFAGHSFTLKQYLMRDYNEEPSFLYQLLQELKGVETLITFNGRAFDWPLLNTRFTMARMTQAVPKMENIDLLSLARKFWRGWLTSCSLNSLENNILGFKRANDIPGAEIPQRYFDYLQTKDGKLLEDIFSHNVFDILSMVVLLSHLYSLGRAEAGEIICPWENFALGKLHEARNNYEKARSFLEKAYMLAGKSSLATKIMKQLGALYKRIGEWEKAEKIWLAVVAKEESVSTFEELAKLYEHRKKDLESAKYAARRGLSICLQKGYSAMDRAEDFEYRLARLERKLKKRRTASFNS